MSNLVRKILQERFMNENCDMGASMSRNNDRNESIEVNDPHKATQPVESYGSLAKYAKKMSKTCNNTEFDSEDDSRSCGHECIYAHLKAALHPGATKEQMLHHITQAKEHNSELSW